MNSDQAQAVPKLLQHAAWRIALMLVFTAAVYPAHAELVLVVNNRSSIEHLSREEAINIFMGRYRKAPDDSSIRPFDLESDSPVRKAFYRQLIDKSPEEVSAYWAHLVFAGRTVPPTPAKGQRELLQTLSNDPSAIGYMDRSVLSGSESAGLAKNLKTVYSFPD